MKKAGLSLAVVVLAGVAASVAWAGARGPFGFVINTQDPQYQYASGSFSDLHNTPDLYGRVDCGSSDQVAYCWIFDPNGTAGWGCYTTDPAKIAVIRSMTDESRFFLAWDSSARIVYVDSWVTSASQPKVH